MPNPNFTLIVSIGRLLEDECAVVSNARVY